MRNAPYARRFFRVSAAQLGVAHGQVRCGSCEEVFDAIEHLRDDDYVGRAAEQRAHADTMTQDRVPQDAGPQDAGPQDAGPQDTGPRGTATQDDALTGTANEPAINEDDVDQLGSSAPQALSAPESLPESLPLFEPELNAEGDAGCGGAGSVVEEYSPAQADSPTAPDPGARPSGMSLTRLNEPACHDHEPGYDLGGHDGGSGLVSTFRAGDQAHSGPDLNSPVPLAILEDLARLSTARRSRRSAWGFGLAAGGLLILLALQAVWFNPLATSRSYPQWHGEVEAFCAVTGCVLPRRREPDMVRVVSRDVRVHPRYEGALQINAVLVNDAPFSQPFPQMSFSLFNVNGQTIASRVFAPAQYLPEGSDAGEFLEPGVPVQLGLELLAPDDVAVSFEFKFL